MSTYDYSNMNDYNSTNSDMNTENGFNEDPAGTGSTQHTGGNRRQRRAARKAGKNTRRTGMKVLAGVLAAGVLAGAGFYGGRVSAKSDTATTASLWEDVSGSDTASASSTGTGVTTTSSSGSGSGSAITLASSDASDSSDSDLTVTEVAQKAMSSVVAITNTIEYQQNGYQLFGSGDDTTAEAAASGSGVIVGITDDEVLIVTNHHVIEDASELSVQFVDGTSADASIKGEDTSADLALLAVNVSDLSSDTLSQITAVTFADSDETQVGEQVVAIGNALGYGQSVTTGIISAKDRDLTSSDGTTEEGLLQTDAAINPGNSGGALLNMKGELVGINVAKYSSTDVEGMGYSIPSNKVAEVVEELSGKTTRSIVDESERGYLGITTATIDASVSSTYNMPQGIYVYGIADGSAAADSDLKQGDIITAFDGQNVSSADDLSDLMKYYKAGETVTLTVERNNGSSYEEKEIQVTLGSKTDTAAASDNSQSSQDTQSQQAQRTYGFFW